MRSLASAYRPTVVTSCPSRLASSAMARRTLSSSSITSTLRRRLSAAESAADPAHQPEADRQTEARALFGLGREEGLEHPIEDFGWHAGPGVFYGHDDVVARGLGGDDDLTRATAGLDRLARIHDRVQEHLLQLLRFARH